jgi:4-guanidinobutyraldehyde dehydrogenase/NAD-dependent aldehyde dehydrogenase
MYSYQEWQQRAAAHKFEGRAFISGQYVDAKSGATRPTFNPATGEKLTDVASCGLDDADFAIASAREAFEAGVWADMAPAARKEVMVKWAALIDAHRDTIALLECLDVGKPISNTYEVDVPAAVRCIRWSGEAIDKIYDEVAPTAPNELALVERLPLGVVAAIVPWNFPLSTTAWKLAPALATGNSVILKPASNTPLTALYIAGLATEAGLPSGVLQVLPGSGATLGKHLGMHMDVDGLTFTGSTPVGQTLMEYSGQSNLKRTFLELGGKSPNIVFADADLDAAASNAATAFLYNSGQTCTAGTRLIVQDSIADEFVEKLVAATEDWQCGDTLDPATTMGPMVDKGQYDTVKSYVDIGDSEGCKRLIGGERVLEEMGGWFMPATIFDGVTNDMRIAQEEIFGPVLSIIRFKDEDDAVRIANDSDFGLAGAVWSLNINTALRVARKVRVGTMGVNNYFGGDMTVPFGGFKLSGNGRDKSIHAFDDYTELKTTWIEING